jgi:hypothetical protein
MKRTHGSKSLCTSLFIACLATTPLTGCSFIFVQPPHDQDGYRGIADCTTVPVAPVIDTIFALANIGAAGYVASEDNVANKGQVVGSGIAVATLWLSSAIYGYYYTSRCSELQREAEDGPYRGPLWSAPHGWRAPVAPRPAPPPAQYAVPPAQAAPTSPTPVLPQQPDDDDPGTRRNNGPAQYPVLPPHYGE